MTRGLLPHSTSSPRTARKPRALVVEHDRWLCTIVASLLEDLGFVVLTASNGCTGLRLALDLSPNLVVVGTNLPELSNTDLRRELERRPGRSRLLLVSTRALLGGGQSVDLDSRIAADSGGSHGTHRRHAYSTGGTTGSTRLRRRAGHALRGCECRLRPADYPPGWCARTTLSGVASRGDQAHPADTNRFLENSLT